MKIPVEWLIDYTSTHKNTKEMAESFTLLGLLLDKPIQNYTKGSYETDVLDLEHRMDRSDWLSILGCARDFAAFEKRDLKLPELYTEKGKSPSIDQMVEIRVECPDIVKRFNTRTFRNITVKESPEWLKNRLEAYGIPSINNIVDITNYVMVEIGQPMHAQDIDKMEKPEIVIRKGRVGESMVTLLGEKINLDDSCFVLTQNDKPTVLGGVVGGKATGVDFGTKNIVLDAGNYDQTVIRRVSRKYKIQNETVLRYDKYLHPKLTEIAINRATKLILELAGGDCYENVDWYPNEIGEKEFTINFSRVLKIGGIDFDPTEIKDILSRLGYAILSETTESLRVKVPYFRTDIEVEDDIAADILRISGYDKIPSAKMSGYIPQEITPAIYKFENKLKDILSNLGLFEYVTDPFVIHEEGNESQIKLENSLSAVKNALRTNMYSTLNPVINTYKKHLINEVGIFEIGKIYSKKEHDSYDYDNFIETRILEVIYNNSNLSPVENSKTVKRLLSGLLNNLGITSYNGKVEGNETKIIIENKEVGEIRWDSFIIQTESLMQMEKPVRRIVSEVQTYSHEDLSIIIDISHKFGSVYEALLSFSQNIQSVEVVEEYIDETIGKDKKAILVRIKYIDSIEKDKLIKHLSDNFDAVVRV